MKIELENIRFAYPHRTDFELNIKTLTLEGNVAIMGDNGSGKTTLGKLVAGLLRPVCGAVKYDGIDIAAWKLGEIGQQVGYLFQEPARQIFAPRPLEEIAFPLELRGIPKEIAHEKARALLQAFELENITENTTYTLSRGEKQRLALAAAMVMNPRFFVLDEPTTGLDPRRREILANTLKKMQTGLLLISHDRLFVEQCNAKIYRMERGMLHESP